MKVFAFFFTAFAFFTQIIFSQFSVDTNTVALWRFDETSGTSITDASGKGNGGIATGTTIVKGIYGNARYFVGNEYLDFGNSTSLQLSTQFTIEAIIRVDTLPKNGWAYIAGKYDGSTNDVTNNFQFSVMSSGKLGFKVGSNTYDLVGKNSIPIKQWIHVAVSYDGNLASKNMKIYINGILDTSMNRTGSAPINSFPLLVGQRNKNGSNCTLCYHNGTAIDEIRISNKARIPTEFLIPNASYTYTVYPNKHTAVIADKSVEVLQIKIPNGTYKVWGKLNSPHAGGNIDGVFFWSWGSSARYNVIKQDTVQYTFLGYADTTYGRLFFMDDGDLNDNYGNVEVTFQRIDTSSPPLPSSFQFMYKIPWPEIEVGPSGILWSIEESAKIYKLNLLNGLKLDSVSSKVGTYNTRGIAWDGSGLWYCDWALDTIFNINATNGNLIKKFKSPGSGPQGLAYDNGYLWHTDEYTKLIYKISTVDGSVKKTLPVPEQTGWFIGIAYQGGYLYLSNYITKNIFKVDTSTGAVLKSMQFPGSLGELACDETFLYVSAWNDSLFKIPLIPYFITSVQENSMRTVAFALSQNYPNPFNPSTKIEYQLPQRGTVVINIYNSLGQLVQTLLDDVKEAGNYSVIWDGRNKNGMTVSSGTYFYQIKTDNFVQSKKMILLK